MATTQVTTTPLMLGCRAQDCRPDHHYRESDDPRIEPTIYRTVIDDVIANIKPEFDEYGVTQEVLDQLQDKWEQKVINSRVADFDNNVPPPPAPVPAPTPAVAPPPLQQATQHHPHMPQLYSMFPYNYAPPPGPQVQPQVKTEPTDPTRGYPASLFTLPKPGVPGGTLPALYAPARPQTGQPPQQPRIPQADGPSAQPPRPTHPSLQPTGPPRPPQVARPVSVPTPAAAPPPRPPPEDDEEINSDLDDSDSDGEQNGEEQATSGAADGDIVFCTYDKVQRVKNKWKCVLKDGVIHMNGRDYLFSKCTGLRRSPIEARRLDNSNALSLTKLVVEAITVACFTVNFSDPSLPIYVFTHAHLS
ncbi:transcription factor IIA, alpha/beta subunit-domain-containing protein [Schizophyllum commune]